MHGNYILVYYIILSKSTVLEVIASLKIIEKGMLPLDKKSVGIQFYIDVENRDRWCPCKVMFWTRRCYYNDSDNNDAEDIAVYGANIHMVTRKDRDTLIYVYPVIIQENHIGSCKFVLDYRCGNTKKIKREVVSIPFDTRAKISDGVKNYFHKRYTCASVDQDVRNNCEPVNCDLKYIGKKQYYNDRANKCVATPICDDDPIKVLPDIVYDPRSNNCKDLESTLSIADVYAITSGLGVVTDPLSFNGMRMQLQTNCTTISENLNFLKDMMYGKLYPPYQGNVTDFSLICNSAILAIISSILLLFFLVLSFVCCIKSSLWIFMQISHGNLSKFCANMKSKMSTGNFPKCSSKKSKVNKDVKNKLLKDVIVTDLPMELRESFENICERINKEVKRKKRYRREDLGSRIDLAETNETISATSSATILMDTDDRCRPICRNRRREWNSQIQNTSAELLLERKSLAECFRRCPAKVKPNGPCPLFGRTHRVAGNDKGATRIRNVVQVCSAPVDDYVNSAYLNLAKTAKQIGAWDAVQACCAFCECGSCCPCGVREYIIFEEENAARRAIMKGFDSRVKVDEKKMRIMYDKI